VQRRRFMVAGAACAALLAGCGRGQQVKYNGTDISGVTYGRDFKLKDPDGRERSLGDFRGKIVLLFFGFTQCPDVCPTALSRAAKVKQLLGPDGDKMQAIFVTVDPERDSPNLLRAYTQSFDPSFLGLYTDLAHTPEVAQEFRIFYQKVPTGGSYTMDHTALTYIYDPQGKLRLAMRHDLTAEQFAADIRNLLQAST